MKESRSRSAFALVSVDDSQNTDLFSSELSSLVDIFTGVSDSHDSLNRTVVYRVEHSGMNEYYQSSNYKISFTMNHQGFMLSLLIILSASCFGKFHHHKDSSYLNHVQLVREFKCASPQRRAIPIEDLLSIGPSPDEIFYPTSTVLARCTGAGCCPGELEICSPIETRNVSLVFLVRHRFDHQRDRHHEIIHAVEHIKCKCINRNEDLSIY